MKHGHLKTRLLQPSTCRLHCSLNSDGYMWACITQKPPPALADSTPLSQTNTHTDAWKCHKRVHTLSVCVETHTHTHTSGGRLTLTNGRLLVCMEWQRCHLRRFHGEGRFPVKPFCGWNWDWVPPSFRWQITRAWKSNPTLSNTQPSVTSDSLLQVDRQMIPARRQGQRRWQRRCNEESPVGFALRRRRRN